MKFGTLLLGTLLAVFVSLSLPVQAGRLIMVTGDGGTPPETLFEVDPATGAATALLALGNGNDGEAITYNPLNGFLYHASGSADGQEFFEVIDPVALVVGPNLEPADTFSDTNGVDAGINGEITALGWYPATGLFLALSRNDNLYSVTLAGGFTLIGSVGDDYRGFAIVGLNVYAISRNTPNLFRLDPSTGAVLETIPFTVDGLTPVNRGGQGLTYDSDTGLVYAIVQSPDAMVPSSSRFLATMNLATGVATTIGPLPDGSAGLTVIPNPPTVIPPDTSAPTVKIRGRKTIETLRKRVVIRGTASDASGIASIEVKAKSGAKVKKVRGTTNWKAVLRVTKTSGRVIVIIRARDTTGVRSSREKFRILRR